MDGSGVVEVKCRSVGRSDAIVLMMMGIALIAIAWIRKAREAGTHWFELGHELDQT